MNILGSIGPFSAIFNVSSALLKTITRPLIRGTGVVSVTKEFVISLDSLYNTVTHEGVNLRDRINTGIGWRL